MHDTYNIKILYLFDALTLSRQTTYISIALWGL